MVSNESESFWIDAILRFGEDVKEMTDCLTKILACNQEVRIVVAETTNLVEKAREAHDTWHTATAAFGRTIIGTFLLASNLKGRDQLSVTIQGQGPIGTIFVDVDAHNHIRGYVQQPHVALELNACGKIDVRSAVGLPATMTVKKFIENFEPFIGQVALTSGEIAEDFTYYMAVSEQTPSSFGLSVQINPDDSVLSAGGFMIQLMPGASQETIHTLERGIRELENLSRVFESTTAVETLLRIFIGQTEDYQIISREPIQWGCDCRKERFAQGIQRLDSSEIEAMIREDNGAEVVCQFCKTVYRFDENDLKEILYNKENIKESENDMTNAAEFDKIDKN